MIVMLAASACTICYAAWQGWFRVGRNAGIAGIAAAALPVFAGGGLLFRMKSVSEETIELFGGLVSVSNPFTADDLLFSQYYLRQEAVREMLSGAAFSGSGGLFAGDACLLGGESFGNGQMLTALIYHFGWIVFLAVAALLFLFIAAGFHICRKQKSPLIRLLSISILATLTLQAVLYISVNLGVTSSMITALPLMSGGAVMLMTDAALIGFLLSLFRTEELFAGLK